MKIISRFLFILTIVASMAIDIVCDNSGVLVHHPDAIKNQAVDDADAESGEETGDSLVACTSDDNCLYGETCSEDGECVVEGDMGCTQNGDCAEGFQCSGETFTCIPEPGNNDIETDTGSSDPDVGQPDTNTIDTSTTPDTGDLDAGSDLTDTEVNIDSDTDIDTDGTADDVDLTDTGVDPDVPVDDSDAGTDTDSTDDVDTTDTDTTVDTDSTPDTSSATITCDGEVVCIEGDSICVTSANFTQGEVYQQADAYFYGDLQPPAGFSPDYLVSPDADGYYCIDASGWSEGHHEFTLISELNTDETPITDGGTRVWWQNLDFCMLDSLGALTCVSRGVNKYYLQVVVSADGTLSF